MTIDIYDTNTLYADIRYTHCKPTVRKHERRPRPAASDHQYSTNDPSSPSSARLYQLVTDTKIDHNAHFLLSA